ncbi:hypothetical protein JSY14_03560 [Brachybacterium sp. EF45031]|uniref:hypothetical protein n=1 Tax=Brachybacterium sillae TaxID=2810536 RepID=UPI00217D2DAC|nr:hypothetical protein [Brachybacterium sillae]MCS6711135.1 hypothetical protein [Brachybacterium sillae]
MRLTKDNTLRGVTIETQRHEAAILNDTRVVDVGTLRLEDVTTVGSVYLVADENLTSLRVEVDGLRIKDADTRGRVQRPHGYGVDVLQGGFTLWNRQDDPAVVVTATIDDLAVGTPFTPVRGSGVFVAGHGDEEGRGDGGVLRIDRLYTGDIVTDGGIAPGTADLISAGVFVVSGAEVEKVVNGGVVATHGQNDMVLDNWGTVQEWAAERAVISTGPSGIGFVNFGDIGELRVEGPIVTVGAGARGYNLYDGSLKKATFQEMRTHGDGSVGVQISRPSGPIEIRGDLATTGGKGTSLVKGVQMELEAIAFSVQEGGELEGLTVGGEIVTQGEDLVTYEVQKGGSVMTVSVGRGIRAHGARSKATSIEGENPSFDGIDVSEA